MHREKAIEMLQHYFAIALGHQSAATLKPDMLSEIESIVDHIIAAAKEQA